MRAMIRKRIVRKDAAKADIGIGKSPLVAVRVPPWIKQELALLASSERRTEAEYVRELFRAHIEAKRARA